MIVGTNLFKIFFCFIDYFTGNFMSSYVKLRAGLV